MDERFNKIAPLGSPNRIVLDEQLNDQAEEVKQEYKEQIKEQLEQQQAAVKEQQTVASYIDNYCERKGQPDPLAEPLNLFTNLVFIVASIMILRTLKFYKQITAKNWDILFLAFTIFVIGIGSAAYHSYPNGQTVLADVIPISIFIHFYLVAFFVRVVGLKIIPSILILFGFIGIGYLFQTNISPEVLNGTIMYVPTYLMLIAMVMILCFVKKSPLYLHLINTAIIWTFSLAFRTMDMQICSHTSHVGTHFLWHIMNGVVLYRMTMLLIVDLRLKQHKKA